MAGFENVSIGLERNAGYRETMLQQGLEPLVIPAGFTEESGYQSFRQFCAGNEVPQLIFVVNDSVAQGVYRVAREMGLAIPADVGVIGFGDLESSQLLSPPLTSLRMPVKQIAFETVRLLVEQIRGNTTASPGLTTFRAELIVRASTI